MTTEVFPRTGDDLLEAFIEHGVTRWASTRPAVHRLWRVGMKGWRMANKEMPAHYIPGGESAQAWGLAMRAIRATNGLEVLSAWARVNHAIEWELDTHNPVSPFCIVLPNGGRYPRLWEGEPYDMKVIIHLRRPS